jgi:CRP-like cAMP-binding protein
MSPTQRDPLLSNRLLTALPKEEYQRLLPDLVEVSLAFGEILYEIRHTIKQVYFPQDSIISLLSIGEKQRVLEVGIVGNEGMLGIPVFLGVSASSSRAIVQRSGTAMRMNASAFRKECNNGGSLQRLVRRYTHSRLTQMAQGAVCNRFHPLSARLARWLLMTRDRRQTDELRATQEFLANMLGVRRERISKAAGTLQQQQLISYNRGILTTLNREGLEAVACQCYGILKAEYDSFLARDSRGKTSVAPSRADLPH